MKRKLNKEEFEKLSDVMKAEYEEKNGSYFAKIEDEDEALEALRLAKKNESDSHSETKKRLKELQDKLEELTNEGSRKRGDVEALENSWKDKFTKRETELTEQINNLTSSVSKSTRDSITGQIAAKISNAPNLMKRVLDERVSVEFVEGVATARVLDATGKPSALTIEDLEKEILANKEYAPIIIASRASGGAKAPVTPAGGTENPTKPFSRMTPSELKAQIDSKGEN